MSVEIREVKTRCDLRKFIHLPATIHLGHQQWLPPIYRDEWTFFDHTKNHLFSHCDTVLLLAFTGKKPIGRIMGIINRRYNEKHGEKHARFGFFECYNDPEVSHALISSIEEWAKNLGMVKIIGPYGFSDKDPQGLMVEGFDLPPVVAAPCNEKYLVNLVEQEGYTKEVDCLMFRFDLNTELPEIYNRIFRRISNNTEYRLLELTRKRDLRPYITPVLRMVNETYDHIYGFDPMDEKEMEEFASRYLPLVNPRFVKIILYRGEVVAFLLGIPNLTKGLKRAKGHLFPIGIFHLLWAVRSTQQIDLMLGGIKPDHKGKGLEILMGLKLVSSAREDNFSHFEIHLVLETNRMMIAEMKKAGAVAHKRFRVFQKML